MTRREASEQFVQMEARTAWHGIIRLVVIIHNRLAGTEGLPILPDSQSARTGPEGMSTGLERMSTAGRRWHGKTLAYHLCHFCRLCLPPAPSLLLHSTLRTFVRENGNS
jgi:hypothetical protein